MKSEGMGKPRPRLHTALDSYQPGTGCSACSIMKSLGSLFSFLFLSAPAVPAAFGAAEVSQVEDGVLLAVAALRLEVAGDVGIQGRHIPEAVGAT